MSRDYERRKRRSTSISTKLRMDTNSLHSKSHGESSGKRKEFDNVMKKARESQSNYWNKKLLEVEEKDPNRWRHSGYKEMYIGSAASGDNRSQIRSPKHRSFRPRSPRPCSPRSPHTPRSRNLRNRYSRSPRRKSPRVVSSTNTARPRSPLLKRSYSPRSRSPKIRKSNSPRLKSPRIIHDRSHNTHVRRAKSPSSGSSCSDRSCSVCSPKERRRQSNILRSRSRSTSSVLPRSHMKDVTPNAKIISSKADITNSLSARSPALKEAILHQTKDLRIGKRDKHRRKLTNDPRIPEPIHMINKHIKVEKVHPSHPDMTVIHPPAESSASDDSDSSSTASHAPPPRMTLSERFGKMAQWSVDRRDMENMRITKVGNNTMKVVIEGHERIARLGYDSPPPGHYPESLLTQGPRGLECWDDVRVRYDYYKSRGYLRDLSLDDYIKWEEWWYKYQEWLEAERYYEQWAAQASNRPAGGVNRKRRRRNNAAH
ncbi:serine/arginine repetitive matrix protein 1 [Copidosoma floridanum]|uniref:serine/arginine repetitive matrix protein 1 n=1 Tax=Copidosoma floridanum TaxID=29053 RepID=UPI0006C94679|nr:serine/arginine repetitive matrix protein 1 [Copidosoma floridanum]XP_014212703.1 serine/arginine repetitive matrix protein 1 [Copidosoma floridanum]